MKRKVANYMKKVLSIVFSAVLLLTCSLATFSAVLVPTNYQENTINLSEKYNYVLTLNENASTGYRWKYTISAPSIVEVISESYSEPIDGKVGSSGTRTFKIQAKNAGKAVITFQLVRSGSEDSAQTYVLNINVKASGNTNETVYERTFDIKKLYTFTMAENATTGYTWKCTISDPKIMKLVSDSYSEPIDGKVGSAGKHYFKLEPLKAGNVVVTFSLSRSFDIDNPAKMLVYKIKVTGSKEIEFTTCKGRYFTISLESNATTGYTWDCAVANSKIVKLVSDDYSSGSDVPGAAGKQVFRFKALKKGTTKITLQYKRSWEDDAVKTKTYLIYVK